MMSSKTVSDLFAEREKLIFAGIAPSDQSRTITGHDFYRVRVHTNRVATLTAFSNQSHPPPSNSAIKRLQSELKNLTFPSSSYKAFNSDSGISAFPEKDTIMCWKGRITGGQGSVFEGKQYKLSLNFPNDYPFKPPCVKFDYPIPFLPNVDVYVKIYLDILLQDESNKWSSAYDVRTVLLSIKSLLDDPNLSTPANDKAATLWSNQKEYRKTVEKLYRPLRYGSEKGTIDRFGGQLWEVGSDGLRRPSSYVKRKVARE